MQKPCEGSRFNSAVKHSTSLAILTGDPYATRCLQLVREMFSACQELLYNTIPLCALMIQLQSKAVKKLPAAAHLNITSWAFSGIANRTFSMKTQWTSAHKACRRSVLNSPTQRLDHSWFTETTERISNPAQQNCSEDRIQPRVQVYVTTAHQESSYNHSAWQ